MAQKQAGKSKDSTLNGGGSGNETKKHAGSKEDGSIHSPLVAYASMVSLLSCCPPFVIFLWYTMVHLDGSASQFWDFCKQQGLQGFLRIFPKPTLIAWKLIASYAAFEAALQLLLPGGRVTGPVSPAGNIPVYKANGVLAYFITLTTYIAIWWSCWNQKCALGYTSATISYALRNMVAIVMATLVGTIIWVGGIAMHDEFVPEISMKSSLLFGVTVLGFTLLSARPSELRNSRRAIVIMVLLLLMMNVVASRAADANSDDVPVGDKLPPDCRYVAHCELCLQCYSSGRDLYCCD